MKVNGRPLPNNPKQAYMLGKLHGTQDTMGNVAMVLLDKCGWHIKEQTADARDTMSISYLYECIVALAEEINARTSNRCSQRSIMWCLGIRGHQWDFMK